MAGAAYQEGDPEAVTARYRLHFKPALTRPEDFEKLISGDHDFIPGEMAAHIASAIPNARLVTLTNCGHFTYLECPGGVRNALNGFFQRTP
jgi:proline iminopeptidase